MVKGGCKCEKPSRGAREQLVTKRSTFTWLRRRWPPHSMPVWFGLMFWANLNSINTNGSTFIRANLTPSISDYSTITHTRIQIIQEKARRTTHQSHHISPEIPSCPIALSLWNFSFYNLRELWSGSYHSMYMNIYIYIWMYLRYIYI